MQAFLEYVVKGLVDKPDAVTVTPVPQGGLTVYELRLDPQDVGKVIGRQGMTINARRQRQEGRALHVGDRRGQAEALMRAVTRPGTWVGQAAA